ncbi:MULTISPECIES: PP2C family protein-serine/threonine phosphatase [Nitrincola]|uniref:PP2C-family Ser/Thr phosphatase n=1 Tax=Nitrincola nitratireducens TaxID=1229521 RepID=W9UWH3_9GAMM|nr:MULTISPECIES: SpoIIE family protein phosphatase [Nitrincola]EXJ09081.1 PP2C-family Ser/Thr phosphatase [Nitrincola nitratireducens]
MSNRLILSYGSSTHQGARPYQEDSCYWLETNKSGCIGFVLSDGMGGHAAGDVASKTLVKAYRQVFSKEVTLDTLVSQLKASMDLGNQQICEIITKKPELTGMGATYLAGFVYDKILYWISVGDSPLYLYSNGKLRQVNEDHSMAPILLERVIKGEITQEQASSHPQKNSLISVVMGDQIEKVDQPTTGIALSPGDVVIIASDGIQTLSEKEIERLVEKWQQHTPHDDLTDMLLQAVLNKKNPKQDNTTIMVAALMPTDGSLSDLHGTPSNASTANQVSWSALMRDDDPVMEHSFSKENITVVKWVILLLVMIVLGLVAYFYIDRLKDEALSPEATKDHLIEKSADFDQSIDQIFDSTLIDDSIQEPIPVLEEPVNDRVSDNADAVSEMTNQDKKVSEG